MIGELVLGMLLPGFNRTLSDEDECISTPGCDQINDLGIPLNATFKPSADVLTATNTINPKAMHFVSKKGGVRRCPS